MTTNAIKSGTFGTSDKTYRVMVGAEQPMQYTRADLDRIRRQIDDNNSALVLLMTKADGLVRKLQALISEERSIVTALEAKE